MSSHFGNTVEGTPLKGQFHHPFVLLLNKDCALDTIAAQQSPAILCTIHLILVKLHIG